MSLSLIPHLRHYSGILDIAHLNQATTNLETMVILFDPVFAPPSFMAPSDYSEFHHQLRLLTDRIEQYAVNMRRVRVIKFIQMERNKNLQPDERFIDTVHYKNKSGQTYTLEVDLSYSYSPDWCCNVTLQRMYDAWQASTPFEFKRVSRAEHPESKEEKDEKSEEEEEEQKQIAPIERIDLTQERDVVDLTQERDEIDLTGEDAPVNGLGDLDPNIQKLVRSNLNVRDRSASSKINKDWAHRIEWSGLDVEYNSHGGTITVDGNLFMRNVPAKELDNVRANLIEKGITSWVLRVESMNDLANVPDFSHSTGLKRVTVFIPGEYDPKRAYLTLPERVGSSLTYMKVCFPRTETISINDLKPIWDTLQQNSRINRLDIENAGSRFTPSSGDENEYKSFPQITHMEVSGYHKGRVGLLYDRFTPRYIAIRNNGVVSSSVIQSAEVMYVEKMAFHTLELAQPKLRGYFGSFNHAVYDFRHNYVSLSQVENLSLHFLPGALGQSGDSDDYINRLTQWVHEATPKLKEMNLTFFYIRGMYHDENEFFDSDYTIETHKNRAGEPYTMRVRLIWLYTGERGETFNSQLYQQSISFFDSITNN
jgi:hypothetical protein